MLLTLLLVEVKICILRRRYCGTLKTVPRLSIGVAVRDRAVARPTPLPTVAGTGCGSPDVKVTDHGKHVMSSSPLALQTRRCTNQSQGRTSAREPNTMESLWVWDHTSKANPMLLRKRLINIDSSVQLVCGKKFISAAGITVMGFFFTTAAAVNGQSVISVHCSAPLKAT
ncbi:hypothetical protein TNCV_2797951 [Trichonephila clavipes]|nr:hypothetical protein TNCV_2797951 [Trichonephila clavipes]